MFFILSKIFWVIFTPLTLIGLLMVAGALGWSRRWGRRMFSFAVISFLLLGFFPIGPNMIVWLENQYARPEPPPEDITGIIVLGGIIDGDRSAALNQVSLNDNAERLTEMMRLSRIYPQARIIFSGGSGSLRENSPKESTLLDNLLKDMDFMRGQIEYESQARNTYENMKFSHELAHPQSGDKWLLVTSAFHLPRSMAIFKKGEWPVIPYPAGYLEEGVYILHPTLDLLGNFYKLQVATREIVGIIAYKLTGKL